MENGDETFASPTAAAAGFEFDFGQGLTNGGGFNAAFQPAAKAYDAAEIDALREAKRDLEEKLAAVCHENHFLTAETRRLEVLVSKARENTAAAEHAAAASEGEAASLRAKVKRLQDLLATEKSDREGQGVGGELAGVHQEKLVLEEEIKALKASAAAAAAEKKQEETAVPSSVAPKEGKVAPHGIVAAAAAGAAATAAIAVVLLNLKRRSMIDSTANEFDAKSGVQTLDKSRYPKAGTSPEQSLSGSLNCDIKRVARGRGVTEARSLFRDFGFPVSSKNIRRTIPHVDEFTYWYSEFRNHLCSAVHESQTNKSNRQYC